MVTRTERVVLELVDDFTTPMARAAAATSLANKELRDLSGTSTQASKDSDELSESTKKVGGETEKAAKKTREYTLEMAVADEKTRRLKASLREQAAALVDQETAAERAGEAFRKSGPDIDRYSGRLRLLSEAAVVGAPGLIPLGAAAIPVVTALAAGLGAAGGALGVLLLGFNGLGDALDAIETARLEPTVENLQAMREELGKLGPAGADFARYLTSLRPELEKLQILSREGMFPGYEDGLDDLLTRLPEVQRIAFEIADSLGELGADAGASLAGPRFEAFFDYLETDAAPTMEAFARSTGNVIEGLANLLVAFAPLTRDFTGGMERMTRSFANWTAGLDRNQSFQQFLVYLQRTGPQVVELLGAMGSAFVGIVSAAAPVGDALLPTLTALARILGAIADSPIGPPLYTGVAALVAVNRATVIANRSLAALGVTATGTGAKLSAIGVAGTAAALAIGTISDAQSQWDSRTRSNATVDSTVKSYQDLVAVLQGSNVGKYAADLGIDVQRLTDDLAENGKNGEYVAEVLDKLGEKSHGFKALLNAEASHITPFWEGGAEKAYDARKDLNTITEKAISITDQSAAAQKRYADAVAVSGRVNRLTRTQVRSLTEAMEEQRASALGAFDAATQYAAALDDARKRAKDSDAGLNASTEAGRKNREALSELAAAWNNQGDAVRNNVGKWREARKNFIDTAVAMGAPIEQARELANRLLEIPKQRVIDIKANGRQAADEIARIRQAIASIKDKEVRINVRANMMTGLLKRPDILDARGQADGGSVPKTGQHYADRHLYLLADGEEVISNRRGQADRYRPLLKAINNAADGATVGRYDSGLQSMAGMGITRKSSVGDAVEAIADLRHTIRGLDASIKDSSKAIRKETRERDRLSTAVDRNQAEVDRIAGLFENLASTVEKGLAANQFAMIPGVATSPWQTSDASAGKDHLPTIDEILASLSASTVDANAMTAATNALKGKGLDGAALESVLAQGLETTQMFASLSPDQVSQYGSAFNTNATALNAAGNAAGNAVYGADLANANELLSKSQVELREQTAELKLITRQNAHAERQRDRAEKELGNVKDMLGDIRSELKKNRRDVDSGTRSKR
jgi:hypothetical protein